MHAMNKKDKLTDAGDKEGALVWQQVADKVEWFQMPASSKPL